MKRAILILAFFLFPLSAFPQNFNWISPNRIYLKLYISEDGMYRLKKSDFTSAGVSTSFDPRTLKMYLLGQQIPVYFQGEQDGVFNDNDYIDFYAKRNYGGNTIFREQDNSVAYTTNEYFNMYSDTSVYWVDWGGTNGIRIRDYTFTSTLAYPNSSIQEVSHFERDLMYSLGENLGPSDYRYLTTERLRGESWYWSQMYPGTTISSSVELPLLNQSGGNSFFRVFAYPQNRSTTIDNEHWLVLTVNGTPVDTLRRNDMNRFDTTVAFPSSLLVNGQNTITAKYLSAPGFSGSAYFDLMEITYPKSFRFYETKASFSLALSDTSARRVRASGYNPANPVFIYDVTNNLRITQFSQNSDTLIFSAKGNANLQVINDTVRKSPQRIKQRQVPDLVSATNGADYLIIYNRLLETQAEQLRGYRQSSDGYRSVKVEIEDIYDIFNYGIEDPIAVRYFMKNAYDNWQQPRVKYLTLFGRGSLDPKKNKPSSAYYINLVPVYGNPPSDGYFVNFNMGSFFYMNQVSVGRIPAYSPSEAQNIVDKITTYEAQPLAEWSKDFTFITGGGTPYEQYYHQQKSNFEIFSYVEPPSLSSMPIRVYRSDTSGRVTYNFADSIRKTFNSGTSFVNFRGHAGSHDWEVGMSDPNTLSNGNKLPLVLSLTCFTGENALGDFRGFGERFLYLPNKGSIGFVGSTGWSFGDIGNTFGTYILSSIRRDSIRKLGDLTRLAGVAMSVDSSSFAVTHTINCYNLIGDPSSKLRIGRAPEFEITPENCKLASGTVLPGVTQRLTISPTNYGLYGDTCVIRFEIRSNNTTISVKDTAYRGFKFKDTISYSFTLDSASIYQMKISLDVTNRFSEENESNNSVTIPIPVKSTIFLALGPVDHSVVYGDSVELSGINPNLRGSNDVKVMVELDTSITFDSPAKRLFVKNNVSGPVTKFKTNIIPGTSGKLYHWRTFSVINGDSSGWSSPITFINGGNGTVEGGEEDRFINSQLFSQIIKSRKVQYPSYSLFNTVSTDSGVKLYEYPATLFIRSYGSSGEEASYFSVGEKNVYIDGGQNNGLNLLKVKRLTGDILQFRNLKFNSTSSSDSLVNFLNTFDSTHYLMLLNASYVPGGTMLSQSAKAKLRQFGSTKCDSIGLISYFHTWSFIGYLGAGPNDVSEMFDPCCRPAPNCVSCDHWTESVSLKNVKFFRQSGTADNIIGPANYWGDFSWGFEPGENAQIKFDVYGIRNNGTDSLLISDISSNKFNSLTAINATEFPRLNLKAKFDIDYAAGGTSPKMTSLNVNFSPAAELILLANTLSLGTSDSKITAVPFSFSYNNAGYIFLNKTFVEVFRNSISDTSRIFFDSVSNVLNIDTTAVFTSSFADNTAAEATKYIVRISPPSGTGEFYTFNNVAQVITGTAEYSTPVTNTFVLLADGIEVKSGDKVGRTPSLSLYSGNVQLPDLAASDSKVTAFLNGNMISVINSVSVEKGNSDKSFRSAYFNSGSLLFEMRPELKQGMNEIVFVFEKGNIDSIKYELAAGSDLIIEGIENFPNPMRERTVFSFGADEDAVGAEAEIRIFTSSGRQIRNLQFICQAGQNLIEWNGTDSDGDIVANGTYLYKLVLKGLETYQKEIKKLVILR